MGMVENVAKLKTQQGIGKISISRQGEPVLEIPYALGKLNSLAIYAHLLNYSDGVIDSDAARSGLKLFDEKTMEAMQEPGKHPSIDQLIEVINSQVPLHATIEYWVPGT